MKELREIVEMAGLKILSEKAKDGTMMVYAKFTQLEKLNKNKRIYGRDLMKREISRVKKAIQSGAFLGTADHGNTPAASIKDTSHIITQLELKGDDGFATLKILPTSAGKNVQELVRGGAELGISMRGTGTVDEKTSRVNLDYQFMGVDIVANPSVPDAVFSQANVFESQSFSEETKDDLTPEEIGSFMGEALQAGVNWSDPEGRKRFIEAKRRAIKSAKSQALTLETEAQRLLEKFHAGGLKSATLDSVKSLLMKEREKKGNKALRRKAISRVAGSIASAHAFMPQEKVQKMIEQEYLALKAEVKKRNQEIFLRILENSKTSK